MNRRYTQASAFFLTLIALIVFTLPETAHAQSIISSFLGLDAFDKLLDTAATYLGNGLLYVSSFFLSACGVILNFSINLTLQIKQYVDQIPAIYSVWRAIRDISGMFIIFALLVIAFQMILNVKRPSFGDTMKNIIIAGVLINFSFFIVGIMIDASNIVSMQIFRQMSPTVIEIERSPNLGQVISTSIEKGSIANVFMNSLRLTQIYKNNGQLEGLSPTGDGTPTWLRILVVGLAGSVMMVTTGLSFLFASVAFLARLGILVFILAFSPFWFASFVIPGGDVRKYASSGWNLLKGQLFFMPAYLLLMYVALQVVSNTNLTLSNSTNFWYSFLGLIANCVFVIIMLNIPLLAALKLGATVPSFLKADKIGADAIWKRVGNFAGTNIIGRSANYIDKKAAGTRIGNTLLARDIRSSTTGALAKSKMGLGRSWEETVKEQKDVKKKDAEIVKRNTFKTSLEELRRGIAPHLGTNPIKETLGKMSDGEVLALGAKDLKDPNVIRYLKRNHFEAIKKSDDFSEDDKQSISEARKTAIKSAVNNNVEEVIKDMMKQYDGKELLGLDKDLLAHPNILPHYTQSQLKTVGEETSDDTRDRIKTAIYRAVGAPPGQPGRTAVRIPVEGWVRKQEQNGNW